MSKYNGWTNYATWRVNLEIFDGFDITEIGWHKLDDYDLAQSLKEHANETLELEGKEGIVLDYARAFISDVNWYEIAKSLRETWQDEEEAA